jgi:hypothetical protein
MRAGVHRCEMRSIQMFRHGAETNLPDAQLYVGLLTRCCTPDGNRAVELRAEGYERQPVRLSDVQVITPECRRLSLDRVSFGPIAKVVERVQHAALYDQQGPSGRILGYAFVQRFPGSAAQGEIAFERGEITLRY